MSYSKVDTNDPWCCFDMHACSNAGGTREHCYIYGTIMV